MVRVQEQTALSLRLFFLHRIRKSSSGSILSNTRHLPRDLHVGQIGVDGKAVVFDLASDSCLCTLADYRQLVTKVSVQSLEVIRQNYRRIALLSVVMFPL